MSNETDKICNECAYCLMGACVSAAECEDHDRFRPKETANEQH